MASFQMRGNDVCAPNSSTIFATVADARRAIDGTGALDDVTVVALWWKLIRNP